MTFRRTIALWLAAGALLGAVVNRAAAGIDPESNTDDINPASELYEIAEEQRLFQVTRQLDLLDAMIWSSGYCVGDLWGPPIGGPPIRQPLGYESKQVAPDRWIYRPLYEEDLPPPEGQPAGPELLPPPANAPRPAPSDARPEDFVPPDGQRNPAPRPAPRDL